MKIRLYLMNAKGLAVLRSLLSYRSTISCVIGSRDQNVRQDYYDEINDLSFQNGIPFFDRHEEPAFNSDETFKMAIGWRWLIKNPNNLIIMHDSLLPRYRGFAPLVAQLIEGELQIGVSAILASERYDEGNLIDQESIRVAYPIKIAEAIDRVSKCYEVLARKILSKLQTDTILQGIPQNNTQATYSLWRDNDDYVIDWTQSAAQIARFVDAVGFPYAGARTTLNGNECVISDAHEVPDVDVVNRRAHIGKVIYFVAGHPVFVCGSGLLCLDRAIDAQGNEIDLTRIRFRSRVK